MKKELKNRIKETKEKVSSQWNTLEERDEAEKRLERLKQLYDDLYGY